MSNLQELQRRVAAVVMQPLTRQEAMQRRTFNGRSAKAEAEALIKPNRSLTSFERLEIYNRQYWFRVLSCFAEDFRGLRAIIGATKFEGLMRAYLTECPSVSFTLRNLGSQLEPWLLSNTKWIAPQERLALDMARLEWAHIEAFDGAFEPILTPADIESAGLDLRVSLQPYIRLLELTYPVDDLLIEVHNHESDADTSSNSARQHQFRRRIRHYNQPDRELIYLAVHRMDDSVYYKRLQLDAFQMLKALSEQKTLEQAIDLAFENTSMPEQERISAIQQWFGNWSELGWFCRPAHRGEV
jgi:Putative DNA-binding domain